MDDTGVRPVGEMSFLAGDGEMARRIRSKDWTGHPFGPPETWPQALRAALGICLQSAFPTAIYWGPELRLLYNDAWAPIPGPRHPAALGAPAAEVWRDIWHVIDPQFRQVMDGGEGLFLENQMLPMQRYGLPEETYWSYSFTPIRGEDGKVMGVFNSGHEMTPHVLAERRMGFLLELDEALRRASGPETARSVTLRLLGTHFGAVRAGLVARQPNGQGFALAEEWAAPGQTQQIAGAASDMRNEVGEALCAGQVVRIGDVGNTPRLSSDKIGKLVDTLGIRSLLAVPWMERGTIAGTIYLGMAAPRDWSDGEVATVEEALHRLRGWLEQERADERERVMVGEIDHRARNALAVVQSIVHLTRAPDIGTFRDKIDQRIGALVRAHSLLAARRWNAIDLRSVVEQELSAYREGEAVIDADGPFVDLPAELAQAVALALHELASNAARHGALALPEGRLTLVWRVEDEGRRVVMDWTETLPEGALCAIAGDGGFGSTLLARVVEGQLSGRLSQEMTPRGLVCSLVFPLHGGGDRAAPEDTAGAGRAEEAAVPQVLIVEDEALVAMDLELMIEEMGYEVFGVYGAVPDALAALGRGTPSLALLDANLRGTSSAPVARALMERGVPIIFATGYEALPEFPEAPTLSKPVSQGALSGAISRILG